MATVETLPLLLKQIGLPMMLTHYQSLEAKAIEHQWSYPRYLTQLCELEANNRYYKRVQRHVKESKLPAGKTVATFDFTCAPSVNQKAFLALADNTAWVHQANNVIVFGPSGVGKTHLACAIGYRLIEQGVRVLFTSTTALVQKLQEAKQQFRLPDALAKLDRYPLLILDDIGYVKKNEQETGVLFELIAQRYETSSLLITANQPFSQWDSIFPDNMMAVAAIDRLVHHAHIFNIKEVSFRKTTADKKQGNKLKKIT